MCYVAQYTMTEYSKALTEPEVVTNSKIDWLSRLRYNPIGTTKVFFIE